MPTHRGGVLKTTNHVSAHKQMLMQRPLGHETQRAMLIMVPYTSNPGSRNSHGALLSSWAAQLAAASVAARRCAQSASPSSRCAAGRGPSECRSNPYLFSVAARLDCTPLLQLCVQPRLAPPPQLPQRRWCPRQRRWGRRRWRPWQQQRRQQRQVVESPQRWQGLRCLHAMPQAAIVIQNITLRGLTISLGHELRSSNGLRREALPPQYYPAVRNRPCNKLRGVCCL